MSTFRNFLASFIRAFLSTFAARNLPWHLLAIGLTAAIVLSGADWQYFLATKAIYIVFFPAVIIGGFLPIVLPIVLWLYAWLAKKPSMTRLGWNMTGAALVGSAVSSVYKAFTGRIQPDLHNYAVDISHGFQFGFWKHGIFWGWPSSHTTIAFCMAIMLASAFPKNKWVRYLSFAYAAYIGVGVSMSIHWLSDAVAGVIIGAVAGREAARSYLNK